ncbi:synaptopodin 2-like protein [Astyanax mexicanus]|uniref:synaptopodin 2-like protein n=1 Tax=Astyanax mexicanus TaxID=7994 RepID=UPI0020CB0D50|nr:synaptopodin 2-like protein [Astyanax mexicanus]
MEQEHDPIRRGVSWSGPGATTLTTLGRAELQETHEEVISCGESEDRTSPHGWEKEKHSWVKVKPALTSGSSRLGRKTNLSRSASLSEKELKEARTRSQIIAAQLTISSNPNSRGVQLFNRRRQRVNAFTLVSVGGGGNNESRNEPYSPASSTLTWDRDHSPDNQFKDSQNHRRSQTQVLQGRDMEAGEVERELADVEDSAGDRHFLPVNEKDEEILEEAKDEVTSLGDSTTAVLDQDEREELELKAEAFKDMPNGCHSAQPNGDASKPMAKQPTIVNRTARPFFSPATVTMASSGSPAPDIPPALSYSTPPLTSNQVPLSSAYSDPQPPTRVDPPFPVLSRPAFSPPPPAPSYPTPPLPTYMSPPQSIHSNPPPSTMSVTSPPPTPTYYAPPTAPRPLFVPQFLSERRSLTPIRTGILDEGVVRRSTRKSMFTFQEKPKLAPNPELLSLVQGTDQMRRGRGQPEPQQPEEELLALGAEASNFLAKDGGGVEEALVPEWASTLKSSRTRSRMEHKPEQALTDASGKGAELFAKRQTRMEKYVHEHKAGPRSPSPTSSLPPSWVYPSNMPGRVKAIVSSSNISAEITKSLKVKQATQKKNVPAKIQVSIPPPVPETPALENGCSRVEMELSRHQPYQLSSSLFILNPTKDPMSTLPKAAPPPKPVLAGSSFPRQTSLPASPITTQYSPSAAYISAHCFSPTMMPPGSMSSGLQSTPVSGLAPERVASPRSAAQAPKPTFSAKKAGIAPQVKEELPTAAPSSRSSTPTPWTPNLSRRLSSPEGPSSPVWSPTSHRSTLVTSPPPRPIHNRVTSSPSPSSSSPRPFYDPVTFSPTPKSIKNPITSPTTPRAFQNTNPVPPFSRPVNNRTATSPVSPPWETRCQSPISPQDTKANHRLLAKNIINAAKRKNSPSPGALSGHSLPMSPVSSSILPFEHKPVSPFQSRSLGAQSPTFTSPPPTPTGMVRSPLRLYNTRSLTDSDASLESEDSGVRSSGVRSYNTCPRGWTGSLRVKRGGMSEDL